MQPNYIVLSLLLIILKLNFINCKIEGWYEEKGDYGLLGCKLPPGNYTTRPQFCQICRPDKRCFTIKHGAANDRYTTIETNLPALKCQIEFKLPLLPEEKGIWSCQFDSLEGTTKSVENTDLDFIRRTTAYAVNGDTDLQLICFSPVPHYSCHFVSPEGNYLIANPIPGGCTLNITKKIGEWSCVMEAEENIQIKIQVKNFLELQPVYNDVEVDEGSSLKLLCQSAFPLAYCRFTNPGGASFFVTPNKRSDNMNFIGNGLDMGECGISITKSNQEHAGTWKCTGMPKNYQKLNPKDIKRELGGEMSVFVDQPEKSYASSIGIGVGVGLAVLVVIGFVVFKKMRKRRSNNLVTVNLNDNENVTFGTIQAS